MGLQGAGEMNLSGPVGHSCAFRAKLAWRLCLALPAATHVWPAPRLASTTARTKTAPLTTVPFIRVVLAVVVMVADPPVGNAV